MIQYKPDEFEQGPTQKVSVRQGPENSTIYKG